MEASRAALAAGLNKVKSHDGTMQSEATFWAVYSMDKELAFNTGRSSVSHRQDRL